MVRRNSSFATSTLPGAVAVVVVKSRTRNAQDPPCRTNSCRGLPHEPSTGLGSSKNTLCLPGRPLVSPMCCCRLIYMGTSEVGISLSQCITTVFFFSANILIQLFIIFRGETPPGIIFRVDFLQNAKGARALAESEDGFGKVSQNRDKVPYHRTRRLLGVFHSPGIVWKKGRL